MRDTKKEAYIKCIQQQQAIINKILYLYADDAESKKDLRQEILAAGWKSFESFQGKAQFSTWLYRIGLNVAFAQLRKKKRQTYVSLQHNLQEKQAYTTLQGEELLQAIIKQLQPVEKSIALLLIEGYNQKEIANLIGLSAVNVRVKVSRLRKKLETYGLKNIT